MYTAPIKEEISKKKKTGKNGTDPGIPIIVTFSAIFEQL